MPSKVCVATLPAVAMAILCGTPCVAATGQVFTVVDFPPTPGTLSELSNAVDLIVLARVDATSPAQADRTGPTPKVRRIQDLTILELLKGTNRGSRIKVRQIGGTVSVDGKDYSADYPVRLLEVGDVVVLFLKRVEPEGSVYDIAYGSDGAVWSHGPDQRITLPAGLSRMPDLAGRAPERMSELLASIRAAKDRSRPREH